MRPFAILLLSTAALCSQSGTHPRAKAADYPAHAGTARFTIGAEYLVHSVMHGGQAFVASDYLVVEVALYPAPEQPVPVAAGHFTLRVNGKKQVLLAEAPRFVAASMKYPDWEQRPAVVAGGGLGDAGIIIGAPGQVGRFPGDRRPEYGRRPVPPRAPEPENPSGMDKPAPVRGDEAVVECALPEGTSRGPVSGYLYFYYKGKTKSVRKLELLYTGPSGDFTLALFGAN